MATINKTKKGFSSFMANNDNDNTKTTTTTLKRQWLIVISVWINPVQVHASMAQWSALIYVSAYTAWTVWMMIRQAVMEAGMIQAEVTKS